MLVRHQQEPQQYLLSARVPRGRMAPGLVFLWGSEMRDSHLVVGRKLAKGNSACRTRPLGGALGSTEHSRSRDVPPQEPSDNL